jgi:hypothetical protein
MIDNLHDRQEATPISLASTFIWSAVQQQWTDLDDKLCDFSMTSDLMREPCHDVTITGAASTVHTHGIFIVEIKVSCSGFSSCILSQNSKIRPTNLHS